MDINILHLCQGMQEVKGLVVVIDVFRDFTTAAFLATSRAEQILLAPDDEKAMAYKESVPEVLLCGNWGEGSAVYDLENSPSKISAHDLHGKAVVLSSFSASVAISLLTRADEVLLGSLATADAIVSYIRQKNPDNVSLLCIGDRGNAKAEEDTVCANYVKNKLYFESVRNLSLIFERIKHFSGAVFFQKEHRNTHPSKDFELCTDLVRFPFVLRLNHAREEGLCKIEKLAVEIKDEKPLPTVVHRGDMLSSFTRAQVVAFPLEVKRALCYGNYTEPEGNFDAALVLGGNPKVLPSRAKEAARLYLDGRCDLFIPSGGVMWESEFGFLTECEILCRYMERFGIPREKILCEAQATTTKENMDCSGKLISERIKLSEARIAVVTSYFHVRRSVMLCRYYFPESEICGIRDHAEGDDPDHFSSDPRILLAVTTECRCLLTHVQEGILPDFPVL